jgi:hypothetical protein
MMHSISPWAASPVETPVVPNGVPGLPPRRTIAKSRAPPPILDERGDGEPHLGPRVAGRIHLEVEVDVHVRAISAGGMMLVVPLIRGRLHPPPV